MNNLSFNNGGFNGIWFLPYEKEEPEPSSLSFNLYNGDCLIELAKVKDKSVDLIYSDLPYGQPDKAWDCLIDLDALWAHFARIRRTKRTPIILTCTTIFGISLINSAPKKIPFRYDLVWVKSRACGHLLAKKQPMRAHEMIYFFYEQAPLYDISSHAGTIVKEAEVVAEEEAEGVKDIYGQSAKSYKKRTSRKYDPPLPRSVLSFATEGGLHPTQKPLTLTNWLFKYYSKEGDTILDCCMGSGGAGVSAIRMNRKFIGIERDPDIYEGAKKRITEG